MEEYSGELNHRSGNCARCDNPRFEHGYTVRLCKDCRRHLSRFPVRKEVRWAAIGVAVILLISLFRLPAYFRSGVDYMKGVRLARERKFVSAEKYFLATLDRFPDHTGALVHLIPIAWYNDDLPKADSLLDILKKRKVGLDEEQEATLDVVISNAPYLRYNDRTIADDAKVISGDTAASIKRLEAYVQTPPYDLQASVRLAVLYLETGNYQGADSLCKIAIAEASLVRGPYVVRLAALSSLHQYKDGLALCETFLSQNRESIDALTYYASFQLKLKQDKEALATISQAYQLAPDNPDVLYMLSLAYHFNHQQKDAEQTLAKLEHLQPEHPAEAVKLHAYITDKIPYRD